MLYIYIYPISYLPGCIHRRASPRGQTGSFLQHGEEGVQQHPLPPSGNSFGGFSGCFGTYIYPWILVLFCFDKSIYLEIQLCLTNLIKGLLDSGSCAGSPFPAGSVWGLRGHGGVWFPCTHSGLGCREIPQKLCSSIGHHPSCLLVICSWLWAANRAPPVEQPRFIQERAPVRL